MKQLLRHSILFIIFFLFLGVSTISADVQRIYDDANLLTDEEAADLEEKAAAYYNEWETDFIIVTTLDADGKDIRIYMEEFADKLADEFNRPEENMVILTMDMGSRDIILSGFGLGEKYIDDDRIDDIRNEITPDLSNENYYNAYLHFFELADSYLGVTPGVNPNSIFFNLYFQIAVAAGLAAIIVFFMAYSSGGRVTVTNSTYMDQKNTRVIRQHDRFIRKTVTKRKKPSNNGGGKSGGGGGGVTGGGRSYSGSRGKF